MTERTFYGDDPNYQQIKFIDRGTFGDVWKVKRKRDGKVFMFRTATHDM